LVTQIFETYYTECQRQELFLILTSCFFYRIREISVIVSSPFKAVLAYIIKEMI